MNFVKVVLGFAPTIAFSVLAPHLGAGWAAGVGLLAAVAVTITSSRGGVNTLSVAQGAVLLAMAVTGLAAGPDVDQALVTFGPSLSGLLLGSFMLATAARFPFTAQIARQQVPRQYWHRPQFLKVNQRISTAWGLAVLASGALGLLAAGLPASPGSHASLPARVALAWVLPVIGFSLAARFSHRTSDQARAAAQAAQLRPAENKPADSTPADSDQTDERPTGSDQPEQTLRNGA